MPNKKDVENKANLQAELTMSLIGNAATLNKIRERLLNECDVNLFNSSGHHELIKFLFKMQTEQGESKLGAIDNINTLSNTFLQFGELMNQSLSELKSELLNTKEHHPTNDLGLNRESYTKKELLYMFNLSDERALYGLEENGLIKTSDGKPDAIKPRVKYLRDNIITFISNHPRYRKNFKSL